MRELSLIQFLDLLAQRAVKISIQGGHLQIDAPRGAVDLELRAELARRKPELIEALHGATASPRPDPLVPIEHHRPIPQTQAQQGMWLVHQLEPDNVSYNIPVAGLIESSVDKDVLQVAIDGLLARHEALRTGFYEDDGELLQSVSADARSLLLFTDISDVAAEERERTLTQRIREQARMPFELSQPPLVRFHLFRLATQRHVLFFNIHHIIADHRSLAVLQEDLSALYQAALRNETAALPDLPIQYPDYAIWLTRRLAEGAVASQVKYWRDKLSGAPPFLDLPFRRLEPEYRTAWGATVPIAISSSLRDALNGVAQQEGATLFMTLLAAFAVLLYRTSGEKDFCIGSPFTGRNRVETESLIGLFVNMLVLRCRLEERIDFREVLRRVRATALEAYEHSEVPFQELVRVLKPDLRSQRSPLFQIMFGFDSRERAGQAGFKPIDTNPGTARYDLTLQLGEGPDGIAGYFEYRTDVFEAVDIEWLAAQFLALLNEVAQHPDRPVITGKLSPYAHEEAASLPEQPLDRPGFFRRFARKTGVNNIVSPRKG